MNIWHVDDIPEDLKGFFQPVPQLGLEKTPEQYVQKLVEVFREVRRALHPSGTLWLNLGDSYAGGGGFAPNAPSNLAGSKQTTQKGSLPGGGVRPQGSIKAKDLVGIPWMVAFALRADGWYLRSEVIWAKGNPMPEAVTDRPTRSHEQIFLLTKKSRYFYDQDAIREPLADYERKGGNAPYTADGFTTNGVGSRSLHQMRPQRPQMQRALEIATEKGLTEEHLEAIRATGYAEGGTKATETMSGAGHNAEQVQRLAEEAKAALGSYWREFLSNNPNGRNKRSVWNINPKPYPEAHFATFPEELPEICIKAGTSEKGCCPTCKAPWDRDGEGWKPTCQCPQHEPEPCVVLDPFAGSGTTLAVACWLRRRYVGVELNPKYAKLIEKRLRQPEAEESQRAAFDLMMTMDED